MADCLVIIDVQKGFMNDSVTAGIPDKITKLLKKKHFDRIVATRFYNQNGSPYDRLMGWKDFMDADSQTVAPSVEAVSEKIIRKPVYTCFVPEFEEYIRENKIDKLYFVGIDTDCCVLKSSIDCFERNIPFEVLINYCASNGGEKSQQAAITVLERNIGKNNINFDI